MAAKAEIQSPVVDVLIQRGVLAIQSVEGLNHAVLTADRFGFYIGSAIAFDHSPHPEELRSGVSKDAPET